MTAPSESSPLRALAETSPAAFHAHLDTCERCANQPFNLCATGATLLATEAEAASKVIALMAALRESLTANTGRTA